jgi:hypothetical protein
MVLARFLSRKVMVFVAVSLGVVLGLGLFTFIYAEGFSYFTTDPTGTNTRFPVSTATTRRACSYA